MQILALCSQGRTTADMLAVCSSRYHKMKAMYGENFFGNNKSIKLPLCSCSRTTTELATPAKKKLYFNDKQIEHQEAAGLLAYHSEIKLNCF